MPPKKKAQAKKRVVSDTHKAAMAAGRESARAVNGYLTALQELRPKRGRKVSKAELEKRLTAARTQSEQAVGTARLLAIQLVEDLEQRIAALASSTTTNLAELENAFAKHAKAYGEAKGISYSSWRTAGVSAATLKRAGISRSSGS